MINMHAAARLCDIPVATLRMWMATGAFKPAFPGRSGGVGHEVSPQQAYGLAIVSCLRRSYSGKLNTSIVKDILSKAERIKDADVLAWWDAGRDSYTEEKVAMTHAVNRAMPIRVLDAPPEWMDRL